MKNTLQPFFNGELQLTNISTNQVTELEFRSKNNRRSDINFHKIWLKDLAKVLSILGNQKIKLLSYIFENMDYNNKIIGSIRTLAEKLNMSNETVSSTLRALKKNDTIRQLEEGVFMLNPDLLVKGDSLRRQILRGEYYGYKVPELLTTQDIEDICEEDLEALIGTLEESTLKKSA